jgi:hypothetical protein
MTNTIGSHRSVRYVVTISYWIKYMYTVIQEQYRLTSEIRTRSYRCILYNFQYAFIRNEMIRNRVFDYGVTVYRQVRRKSILLLQLVVVLVLSIDWCCSMVRCIPDYSKSHESLC